MLIRWTHVLAAAMLAGGAAACSRAADTAAPVATPTVTLNKTAPAIGSPVDMTYRFAVAGDAPSFDEEYWVFAHFLDSDGELMWTDDHEPTTPVRQWKPGATIEYSRTMFIPKFPYVGPTRVQIGLFSPTTGERLPLSGQTEGQRAYDVATFDMRLDTDSYLVVFKDGWHQTELSPDGNGQQWQWSMGRATLAFRNPRRDARFYLQVDQPVTGIDPQRVELRIGDAVIDSFTLNAGGSDLRRVAIPAAQLGGGETVELTLSVDKTFVPALVPALKNGDPRNLGIRVFGAFVEPS
jgi:hypothetical protein